MTYDSFVRERLPAADQLPEFRLLDYPNRLNAAAELLKGTDVAVPRSDLPDSGEKNIYWADLVGLEVINQQNITLGKIESLLETGAHDVLVVKGDVERLIPYVDAFIINVDLAAKRMTVDWQQDY